MEYREEKGYVGRSTIYKCDGFEYLKTNKSTNRVFLKCYLGRKYHGTAYIDLKTNKMHINIPHNHEPMTNKRKTFMKDLKESSEKSNKSVQSVYNEVG